MKVKYLIQELERYEKDCEIYLYGLPYRNGVRMGGICIEEDVVYVVPEGEKSKAENVKFITTSKELVCKLKAYKNQEQRVLFDSPDGNEFAFVTGSSLSTERIAFTNEDEETVFAFVSILKHDYKDVEELRSYLDDLGINEEFQKNVFASNEDKESGSIIKRELIPKEENISSSCSKLKDETNVEKNSREGKKQVFSFRSRISNINVWKSYAIATGETMEKIGERAMNEYINRHKLTGARLAVFEALTERNNEI